VEIKKGEVVGILKKRKYFIGGYEGDQLEPIINSLIDDAKQEDKLFELGEICSGVIAKITGGSIDEIEKKLWDMTHNKPLDSNG